MASLPLGFAGCNGQQAANTHDTDLAAARDMLDAGTDLSVGDLSGDLSTDTCESLHPPTLVELGDASLPDAQFNGNCWFKGPCTTYCPPTYTLCCGPLSNDGGDQLLNCVYYCGSAGRRPVGLKSAVASAACDIGQHFARMAHLEAASVHAFRILARELSEHGAPAQLARAARRAIGEEARHARVTARLARSHGARPSPVEVAPTPARSLETMAIENAVEGCVRETFGALVASWQARAAGDQRARRAMIEIARDEIGHAQLAWDVNAWASTRLGPAGRRRVAEARRKAVADLASEMAEPPARLRERLGLPSAERSRYFLAATRDQLWV